MAPRFVWSMAHGAFPRGVSFRPSWAFAGPVFQRAIATCSRCLALGSYVAVFVALEALLQTTLPLISLALTHLALPHQSFIDDFVCVLCLCEFDYDGGHRFDWRCLSGQPSYVSDICCGDEWLVCLQDLVPDLSELFHVYRTGADAVYKDPICWGAD